ncbi:hypothetical protein HHL28_17560 [Aerophototrophica crusticola]|uniref:Serine aminopeptidase S33 domain-containing protein n=1 Tax=Aerophototrophica crusticola TaxID=1709002 RepID=A0A858RBA1_9PROT|nr:hypothetical protein HHL28_17560 [Rhodospirillaceae bacterium B3]
MDGGTAQVGEQDVTLATADGRTLAATRFTPARVGRPPVLIAPATAVRRGYYARFARFLAGLGHPVLTLDYRGVGGSLQGPVRRYRARMQDWGRQDLDAALRHVAEWQPGQAPLVVAHSVGGQVLPLAESAHTVAGLYLVASQSGAPRHWKGLDKAKLAAFWYGLVPVLTRLHGHLPGYAMGSEPLPLGIAREWARWGRHPDYILGHLPELRDRFKALSFPIRQVSFSDDFYCPEPAAAELLSWYGGTAKTHRHLRPADIGAKAIGHFGYFRDRFAAALWQDAADWLAAPR